MSLSKNNFIYSLCSGTVSRKPTASSALCMCFTHLCPRFAQASKSAWLSLCSGMLLWNLQSKFLRRPSKDSVLCACSSQPHSHFAQHASRFAQLVQSHYASLCSGKLLWNLQSKFLRRLRSAIAKAHRFVDIAPAHAFTMAEAIIVMTILGIIATIMITNLKPTEFRDKGLEVLAKKIINQID